MRAANTAERGIDGMSACHREETHTYKKRKMYAWCPQGTDESDKQEQARQRQRTCSPCDQTIVPDPRSYRPPTLYGEKPRHRHTQTNHIKGHHRCSNVDTPHRQRNPHAYVIVDTATPAIALKTHFTWHQHLEPPFPLPPCPKHIFYPVSTPQTPFATAPMPTKHIPPSANTSNPLGN